MKRKANSGGKSGRTTRVASGGVTSGVMTAEAIQIRGARVHNLRNLDVDVPTGKLVVVTGVSGSGKSSLALDVLFAEGQRRYLESVAVRTRTLIGQLPRPDVDRVSGLPPTVAVDQKSRAVPRRSTLAVTTEIYDHLRLLFARAGVAHCTQCQKPVTSHPVSRIVAETLELPEKTRIMVLAPLARSQTSSLQEVIDRIIRYGFVRARIDGELLELAETPQLNPAQPHTVDAVIDRIVLKDGIQQRVRESIELACRESEGICIVCYQQGDAWIDRLYSTKFSCPECQLSFQTPEPRSFSFQSPLGACSRCQGLGVEGSVVERGGETTFRAKPCRECSGTRLQAFPRGITFLGTTISEFTSRTVDEALQLCQEWMTSITPECIPASELRKVAERIVPEISRRLLCLKEVGVGYLQLSRETRSLSGGEYQRARLAAVLGTGLYGACFILDEPTAGLHPADTEKLIVALRRLRDTGATVVVVEHDRDVMAAADWIIDIGPGAGRYGGELVFSGRPVDLLEGLDSLTRQPLPASVLESPTAVALRGRLADAAGNSGQVVAAPNSVTSRADSASPSEPIRIVDAALNNLRQISVSIPTQSLVAVTGVSGSGKTSLILRTLLPVAESQCHKARTAANTCRDVKCKLIEGLERFQRVVSFDGRTGRGTARSCTATISGLWDQIRRLLAKTKDARARGLNASYFSFNSGGGRCPACRGAGTEQLKLGFLPSATVPCGVCLGKRFTRQALSIRFGGRNAAEILAMTVSEAALFFQPFDQLHQMLRMYEDTGLGYLTLGQSAATLSGGELQRVMLTSELFSTSTDETLFILDEPTSGLHTADTQRLIALLRRLIAVGHSIVVVEHNPTVVAQSDWVIDLGPGAGSNGGQVVFEGPPSLLPSCEHSLTGQAMATRTEPERLPRSVSGRR